MNLAGALGFPTGAGSMPASGSLVAVADGSDASLMGQGRASSRSNSMYTKLSHTPRMALGFLVPEPIHHQPLFT